ASMSAATKRKTSVTIDAAALDAAHDLGINVSAVADAALQNAVAQARRSKWLDENADAFARQAEWHERNGHPLAEILASPGTASWSA
ncbi:type II toxin-antitoxin system CcdA family antitoxin, partial [Amaricoccus sp.]